MNAKGLNALLIALVIFFGWSIAWSAQPTPYPANATFTTLITTPLGIEGLTGDGTYLYTAGRQTSATANCPLYRVNLTGIPQLETVGFIPAGITAACNTAGVALDGNGFLYVAESANVTTKSSSSWRVWRLMPDPSTMPLASVYADNVPGANGIAFKGGDLWISDGTTNRGRVWKVGPGGGDCDADASETHVPNPSNCTEVFRIQPMNNSVDFGGDVANPGVGRVNTTIPGNAQNLVANGLAFNLEGNLLVADTARGAIWLVKFDKNGNLVSKLDCDHTFDSHTLCLENLVRADPRLEGIDGIALDVSGNIWGPANERNAIIYTVFYGTSDSVEVFRNPINSSGLRNSATDNTRILEFPTSPFLSGTKFCVTSSDNNRRDNSPSTAGQIGGASGPLGKISCMDQALDTSGLPLPR
jgi:hypothetical protein